MTNIIITLNLMLLIISHCDRDSKEPLLCIGINKAITGSLSVYQVFHYHHE